MVALADTLEKPSQRRTERREGAEGTQPATLE